MNSLHFTENRSFTTMRKKVLKKRLVDDAIIEKTKKPPGIVTIAYLKFVIAV